MIQRTSQGFLDRLLTWYPVVVVTGPRQSGKTTLCRSTAGARPYVNLESPVERALWAADPVGALRRHPSGAVIDEFQRLPELASWLQVEVDRDPTPGRWLLTGSQNLAVSASVSQSLAGRAGQLTLLPPALAELRRFPTHPTDLWETVYTGAYPRIHDRGIPPQVWLADYVSTYVTRDARDLLRIGDLATFTRFVRLIAGRTGQELNLTSLGGDVGVSQPTARAWLSALEATWIGYRLPRWARNVTSQVVKTPKLHFFDTGLVCYLLGIREPDQLALHPLRGAIFETWVAAELYKQRAHHGLAPDLGHFRDAKGLEADLVWSGPDQTVLVEVKSGETPNPDALRDLVRLTERVGGECTRVVLYGGDTTHRLPSGTLLSWREIDDAPELAPLRKEVWTR